MTIKNTRIFRPHPIHTFTIKPIYIYFHCPFAAFFPSADLQSRRFAAIPTLMMFTHNLFYRSKSPHSRRILLLRTGQSNGLYPHLYRALRLVLQRIVIPNIYSREIQSYSFHPCSRFSHWPTQITERGAPNHQRTAYHTKHTPKASR